MGEFVFLKGSLKVQPIFLGPIQIFNIFNNNTVELDLSSSFEKSGMLNIKNIKKFVHDAWHYPKELLATAMEKIFKISWDYWFYWLWCWLITLILQDARYQPIIKLWIYFKGIQPASKWLLQFIMLGLQKSGWTFVRESSWELTIP